MAVRDRGARHDAVRHGDHSGAHRAPRRGQRGDRAAGGRDRARRPAAVADPHAGGVRQRDHRPVRARRIDQRRRSTCSRSRDGPATSCRSSGSTSCRAARPCSPTCVPPAPIWSTSWTPPAACRRCCTSSAIARPRRDHDRRIDRSASALRTAAPARSSARFEDPVKPAGGLAVLRGSLAPRGAVLKVRSADPSLLRHRGRAVVFEGVDDVAARIDDPALDIDADSVLVLRNVGPKGAPGMPEWGMVPIPRAAAPGRRARHGPHLRRAHVGHRVRHLRAARRARVVRRRSARARSATAT